MIGILYLLAILSKILTVATIVAIISGIAVIVFLITKTVCSSLAISQEEDGCYRSERKLNLAWVNTSSKILKSAIPTFIISMVILMFVPTTKEAYVIYGVGATINYLKENDTAKQLPDKAINALDSWLEAITVETKEVVESEEADNTTD